MISQPRAQDLMEMVFKNQTEENTNEVSILLFKARDYDKTRSASARRRWDDGFDSWPKLLHS